jgi:aerobic carbon-monoxide dehydrogenase small subunit
MFTVQARSADIVTIEGLAEAPHEAARALQAEFCNKQALQCGYCTPGFLISAYAYLRDHPDRKKITENEVRQALSGNLCRCTGYQNIVKAVLSAAAQVETDGLDQ